MSKTTTIGPQINIPEGMRGTLNESTPADQRVPDRIKDIGDGPIRGANEEFLPARYEQTVHSTDSHGQPVEHKIIVENR